MSENVENVIKVSEESLRALKQKTITYRIHFLYNII